MFKAATAHSEDVHLPSAMDEIFGQLRIELKESIPQAGILFCCLDFDHAYILSRIRAEFPGIELIGCTTDGEMSSRNGLSEDSVALMVFATEQAEIRAGAGKALSIDGLAAGREAAQAAVSAKQRNQENRFAIILTDPLNAGVSDVSEGIGGVLGSAFPLFGGASAAHSKRRMTYQFYNDEVLTDGVVLLLFSGPVLFSFGIRGGHSAIGGKEKITSSAKNVLYTINNKPAYEYLRRYIGDNHDLFMNYCLAVFDEEREGFYVRSAPFSDPKTGTVTLNGVVKEGSCIQIGTADKNACGESCKTSVKMALDGYPGKKPSVALLISCAGRKKMLGTQAAMESGIAKEYFGDIPFGGYYAYGEICPLTPGSGSLFHGTTFVTVLIGEE